MGILKRLFVLLPLISLSVTADDECGLYMALSSTSGTEGTKQWGLYAGKDIEINQTIGFPEVAINMPHFEAYNIRRQKTARERIVELIASFMWVPEPAGARFEMKQGSAVTAIPGPGILGCFHPKFKNAKWNHTMAYSRPNMGEEPNVAHPGRGAYSPFYNVALRATDVIKRGTEVFVDFGSNWEEEEEKDAITKEQFETMDETVAKMIEFYNKHPELDDKEKMRVYSFLLDDVMEAAVGKARADKFKGLLPNHPDELPRVLEMGGTKVFSEPEIYRSVEWLEEHGRCVDNIRPGASKIPHAGRGAFATRPLSKDSIIAPIPLIHIPDKAVLDEYPLLTLPSGEFLVSDERAIGQQLVYNYCFGHPDSKMVFLPAGVVTSFINHGDEPNAKLVWSHHPAMSRSWFHIDPSKLVDDDKMEIGLVLEVVALRDIAEGEEVTIDYGKEWKSAWDSYVSKWKKLQSQRAIPKEWPARAVDLNEEYASKPFKIEEELEEEPYPTNILLKAYITIHPDIGVGSASTPKLWDPMVGGRTFEAGLLIDVDVLSYEEAEDADEVGSPFVYTIRWTNKDREITIVEGVPHHAFVFVDAPETGDQYATPSFRHYIGIPDEIFPQGPWRNLK